MKYITHTVPLSVRTGKDQWKDRFTRLYEPLGVVAKKVKYIVEAVQQMPEIALTPGRLLNSGLKICSETDEKAYACNGGGYFDSRPILVTAPNSLEQLCTILNDNAAQGTMKLVKKFEDGDWSDHEAVYEFAYNVFLMLRTPKIRRGCQPYFDTNMYKSTYESRTDKLHLRLGLTRFSPEGTEKILSEIRDYVLKRE